MWIIRVLNSLCKVLKISEKIIFGRELTNQNLKGNNKRNRHDLIQLGILEEDVGSKTENSDVIIFKRIVLIFLTNEILCLK